MDPCFGKPCIVLIGRLRTRKVFGKIEWIEDLRACGGNGAFGS